MDFAAMISKTTADHFEKEFAERNEYLEEVKRLGSVIIFSIRNPETRRSRSASITEVEMIHFHDPFEELLRERLFPKGDVCLSDTGNGLGLNSGSTSTKT